MKQYWYLIFLLILTECAQQVPPTGGPKDITPPKLTLTQPNNKALNFKGKSMELFFDEYVIVDNIQQKLIITPEIENPYTYKLKGESVVLNFKKPFPDSTTFTLNFGDAIKDFSEKLPVKNLKLVFSTGPVIDSAQLQGKVINLLTNKPVFDALVGLYKLNDTLNPEKQKPYYFSRTDSSGHFSIENVQLQPYKLIAIDDKNRNLLYNAKDERIAYVEQPVTPTVHDTTGYTLHLFASDLTIPRIQRTTPKVNNYTVLFNKNMDTIRVSFPKGDSLAYVIDQPNALKFFSNPNASDTTLALITATDSLGQTFQNEQKIAFLPKRGKERQKEPLVLRTTPEKNEPISKSYTYTLSFNKPISKLDPEKIQFVKDSTSKLPLTEYKYTWNTYHNELQIVGIAPSTDSLKLTIEKNAIFSIENDTLPATSIRHPFFNEDNYGIVRGKVLADTSLSYFIELLDRDYKVQQTSYTSPFTFKRIPPGEYYMRLIIDKNRNKRWDTGNYPKKLQPEPIIFFPEKLTVKSNFEYEDNNFTIPTNNTPER